MVQTRAQKQLANNQSLVALVPQPRFNVQSVNKMFEDEACLQAFPHTIRRLYQIIGDINQSTILKDSQWNMLSLQKVVTHHKMYVQENEHCRSVDFAFMYHGMGYHVVCSVDKHSGRLYYRLDGGSDGHAVEYNYNFCIRYVPNEESTFIADTWISDVRANTDVSLLAPLIQS